MILLLTTKSPLRACVILIILTFIAGASIPFISSKWESYLVLYLVLRGVTILFVYVFIMIIKKVLKISPKKCFY